MDITRKKVWLSGLTASLASTILLQPLDVVKTHIIISKSKKKLGLFSSMSYVYNKFGIQGFWRGWSAALSRTILGSGLYFVILEELMYLSKSDNFLVKGICSGIAKVSIITLCQPISIIKTRLESPTCEKYSGLINGASQLYKNEGFFGFYKGLVPNIFKEAPYSTISYGFYEKYIDLLIKFYGLERKNIVTTGAAGILSGITASILLHPFDVIKTNIQLADIGVAGNIGIKNTTLMIYNNDGLLGFTKGILPRLIRRSLSSSLILTTYEQLKSLNR